jgi:hypothetical protein
MVEKTRLIVTLKAYCLMASYFIYLTPNNLNVFLLKIFLRSTFKILFKFKYFLIIGRDLNSIHTLTNLFNLIDICHHSYRNSLYPCRTFRKLEEICKIITDVALYGCDTWTVTLKGTDVFFKQPNYLQR